MPKKTNKKSEDSSEVVSESVVDDDSTTTNSTTSTSDKKEIKEGKAEEKKKHRRWRELAGEGNVMKDSEEKRRKERGSKISSDGSDGTDKDGKIKKKKKKKINQAARVNREILYQLKISDKVNAVPKAPINRLVRETAAKFVNESENRDLRFTQSAIKILHWLMSDEIVEIMSKLNKSAAFAKRVTIQPRDLLHVLETNDHTRVMFYDKIKKIKSDHYESEWKKLGVDRQKLLEHYGLDY